MGVLDNDIDKPRAEKPTKPDEEHVGEMPELPVCTHGSKVPGEDCVRTTEVIANCVGKELGKAMRDVMVNGTLVARGEVVSAEGQFGLRLVDVVSPKERLSSPIRSS